MKDQPRDFYNLAHHLLRGLYSFVPASAVDGALVKQLGLRAEEILVGMYLNAPDHFVVFTSTAIHWIKKERESICPYGSIAHLKLPDDEQDVRNEREIEIGLKDGDFLFLPILGETEDELDIYTVAEYLESAISSYGNLISLNDLIARLKAAVKQYKDDELSWKQPMPVEYFESLIAYLEKCLVDCLNGPPGLSGTTGTFAGPYDHVTLDQPQTWRLMAEVLLAPKTLDPKEGLKEGS